MTASATPAWGTLPDTEKIDRWRETFAAEIGCNVKQAQHVVENKQIDLHVLANLVSNGCSIDLALAILT